MATKAIHVQLRARRKFGQPGNLAPNIGSPLCDSASVASSCRTSQCSASMSSFDQVLEQNLESNVIKSLSEAVPKRKLESQLTQAMRLLKPWAKVSGKIVSN